MCFISEGLHYRSSYVYRIVALHEDRENCFQFRHWLQKWTKVIPTQHKIQWTYFFTHRHNYFKMFSVCKESISVHFNIVVEYWHHFCMWRGKNHEKRFFWFVKTIIGGFAIILLKWEWLVICGREIYCTKVLFTVEPLQLRQHWDRLRCTE